MQIYLNIVQIIISAALIALTVIQGRGSGLGNMFGGGGSVQRTRRGVEKTMYNLTVVLAVVVAAGLALTGWKGRDDPAFVAWPPLEGAKR